MNLRHPEVHLFFNALTFFTRIPAPSWVEFSDSNLNHASRYFPWIGLIVGATAALVYLVACMLFPPAIAITLSMVATVWLTGGFHEDGLADVCDGFGGGWKKTQILTIMKDSRLGTYGALGLVFALFMKFQTLSLIEQLIPALLLAHTLSRFAAITLIYSDDYVREDQQSKAKPLANRMSRRELMIAAIPVLLCLIPLGPKIWLVIIPVWLMRNWLSYFFRRWIGGYTGDCLGATQQLCELTVYLYFCLPFILAA
ncbi:adenosylcobinamide-GDP ribazoletransferase [Pontibacterium sp. N1Y112]|uniref:Adenosylcobinamide-GDP ribazoletransferase n=1 Tax=Pontibacterium sinense TaxID=2781979 RepID=A0A8J7K8W6_9GAMM|nr:adenosylcobinamide-GDP ribazoletransferase [Pontibacterium sinense]MBE9399461.1 adenosylcobinamide-GDP ribazoletransferase [Pontibacterium sinense]